MFFRKDLRVILYSVCPWILSSGSCCAGATSNQPHLPLHFSLHCAQHSTPPFPQHTQFPLGLFPVIQLCHMVLSFFLPFPRLLHSTWTGLPLPGKTNQSLQYSHFFIPYLKHQSSKRLYSVSFIGPEIIAPAFPFDLLFYFHWTSIYLQNTVRKILKEPNTPGRN